MTRPLLPNLSVEDQVANADAQRRRSLMGLAPAPHAWPCGNVGCTDCYDEDGDEISTADPDHHWCKGEEGCTGHPDCEYAICDGCRRPNLRCVCP